MNVLLHGVGQHCARRHGDDSWICLFLGVRTPEPGYYGKLNRGCLAMRS
ncbi:MAG: hypothetical protein Q7T07_12460 [Burkholderiaceae bacterium]|nr:hypothetical protein [Burkholderiaceae bacterium]